ncbi:hypothetical protein FRE64_08355 [Euhalothece natronophila Z-M001]|uniref:DUF7734 domain-containing protein n=1 Tax=Euhalothece natronophila Z-M001 TaxID=522448 RepID=A0A5B8NKU0_9CHRO|nr:hypothetical protein [Euhalothece natronophila]QDZ39953.1 hypothetical protein FRE64_08355 [Euhalothece natronophila Z-M001]
MTPEKRLEQYTLRYPQEVLLLDVELEGEADQILIFKGFSSSLMNPTAYDPDVPVLAEEAKILSIDRASSPYNPDNPQYIEQNISWDTMENRLTELGL